jgi:TonB-dependent receptor
MNIQNNKRLLPSQTMNTPHSFKNGLLCLAMLASLALGTPPPASGQESGDASQGTAPQGTGTIEGRVYFPDAGRYLENVRVLVGGTQIETWTDVDGSYYFFSVPAGTVTVMAYYTGFAPQSKTTTVLPGQTARLDIDMVVAGSRTGDTGDEVVKLEKYVVQGSKEEFGAAIALQEQRYSANMRLVVTSDEFGENPTGNVGEFLRHLPGVTVVNTGGEARTLSIEGVPAEYVPITYAGFEMANAASSSTSRQIELETVSVNNIARLEVVFAPTPETPGHALAGYVNMVPRSAFERSRPVFSIKTYVTLPEDNFTFHKTPGPWFAPTRKVAPNVDFTYIVPYNKRFGFTVSAGRATYTKIKNLARNYWRGVSDGMNGTTFPITSPDNPYLSRIDLAFSSHLQERVNFSVTADYRLSRADRLSFAFQYGYNDIKFNDRQMLLNMQKMVANAYGLTYSEGEGFLRQEQSARRKTSTSIMPTLTYRHIGRYLKIDAGLGYSKESNHYSDTAYGFFNNAHAEVGNALIIFDDITRDRPLTVTVMDKDTKALIDPYSLDDYSIVRAYSRPVKSYDAKTTAYIDARYDFLLGGIPFWLKTGLNLRKTERTITHRPDIDWYYLGADGISNHSSADPRGPAISSDDGASIILDESYSTMKPAYGPSVEWMDLAELYQIYEANPDYFMQVENSSGAERAKEVIENIYSAYFRMDTQLLNHRLLIVTGLRGERTDVEGKGPRRDVIAGTAYWTRFGATSSVTFTNWFPSLNLQLKINPSGSWLLKGAYYQSIGRPNYDLYMGGGTRNGQYVSGLTIPDLDSPASSTTNRFGINNPNLKPWTAKTFRVALEYYFTRAGSLTLSAFTRTFINFFVDETQPVTREFLEDWGLDYNLYEGYYLYTQGNSNDDATVRGLSFAYRQSLTFLPNWARGITVYANANLQDLSGPGQENFLTSNYVPRQYNAGITLSRRKFTLGASWSYASSTRYSRVTGTNIPEDTYTWRMARYNINLSGEYRFGKNNRFAAYFYVSNVTGQPQDNYEIKGPDTPRLASQRYVEDYAPQWTFGLKATF